MIILKCLGFAFFANAGILQPLIPITKEEIKMDIERMKETLKRSKWRPEDINRMIGPRGWEECNPIYADYKNKGYINDADIEIWRSAEAAPNFSESGLFMG
jgi:hypothetical protein